MLDEEKIESLVAHASAVSENSYCPYSCFPVGAAVLTRDGSVYVGCNVENLSFGATICAERVAVGAAVADGKTDIEAIAIYHKGEDLPYPCGICRQVLSEFGMDIAVIVANGEVTEQYNLSFFLPHAFDTKEI